MLATFAPAAAFVPAHTAPKSRRTKPFITTAAVVALAGALTAGSVARDNEQPQNGSGSTVHAGTSGSGGGGQSDADQAGQRVPRPPALIGAITARFVPDRRFGADSMHSACDEE